MRNTILSLCLALIPVAGLADDCETVMASFERLAVAPAIRQTIRMGGAPPMEMVSIGDQMFLDQGGGQWFKLPVQPGARAAMMKQALPDASALKDCREAGRESVDGMAMMVYEYLPPSFGGETPALQKLWIGDADGLPYRMTTTSEGGPMDMTVSYEGVTAPIP